MQHVGSPGVRAWLTRHSLALLPQLPPRSLVHLAQFCAVAGKQVRSRALHYLLVVCSLLPSAHWWV